MTGNSDGGADLVPETMTVKVRDHDAEAARWGVGLFYPSVRTVTISAFCPRCGERRGVPRLISQVEDGEHYDVHTWTNLCGHKDFYRTVITEAEAGA